VPESDTVLGLAKLPAATRSVAVFGPALVGLKLTLIAQLAPAASKVPQLFVCVNCAGLVPVRAIDVSGNATLPVLRSVIVFALVARLSG